MCWVPQGLEKKAFEVCQGQVTPSHLGQRVGYQSTLEYQRVVAKNVRGADLKKAYGYVILRPDDEDQDKGREASGVSSGHQSHYISCLQCFLGFWKEFSNFGLG